MKTAAFDPERVASFLKRRKIATLGEIGEAMGNASQRSVFRNLSRLECPSSYSHRGKFYTLRSIAKFSREGLWSLRSVWFSRVGMRVCVSHYPPGSSKWNPIEHRMFSFISKNWAAQPLRDYDTALNFIRATKTSSDSRMRPSEHQRLPQGHEDI